MNTILKRTTSSAVLSLLLGTAAYSTDTIDPRINDFHVNSINAKFERQMGMTLSQQEARQAAQDLFINCRPDYEIKNKILDGRARAIQAANYAAQQEAAEKAAHQTNVAIASEPIVLTPEQDALQLQAALPEVEYAIEQEQIQTRTQAQQVEEIARQFTEAFNANLEKQEQENSDRALEKIIQEEQESDAAAAKKEQEDFDLAIARSLQEAFVKEQKQQVEEIARQFIEAFNANVVKQEDQDELADAIALSLKTPFAKLNKQRLMDSKVDFEGENFKNLLLETKNKLRKVEDLLSQKLNGDNKGNSEKEAFENQLVDAKNKLRNVEGLFSQKLNGDNKGDSEKEIFENQLVDAKNKLRNVEGLLSQKLNGDSKVDSEREAFENLLLETKNKLRKGVKPAVLKKVTKVSLLKSDELKGDVPVVFCPIVDGLKDDVSTVFSPAVDAPKGDVSVVYCPILDTTKSNVPVVFSPVVDGFKGDAPKKPENNQLVIGTQSFIFDQKVQDQIFKFVISNDEAKDFLLLNINVLDENSKDPILAKLIATNAKKEVEVIRKIIENLPVLYTQMNGAQKKNVNLLIGYLTNHSLIEAAIEKKSKVEAQIDEGDDLSRALALSLTTSSNQLSIVSPKFSGIEASLLSEGDHQLEQLKTILRGYSTGDIVKLYVDFDSRFGTNPVHEERKFTSNAVSQFGSRFLDLLVTEMKRVVFKKSEPKAESTDEPRVVEVFDKDVVVPKGEVKVEPKKSKTLKIQAPKSVHKINPKPLKTPLQRKLDREQKEGIEVVRTISLKKQKKPVAPLSSDKLKELAGINFNYKTASAIQITGENNNEPRVIEVFDENVVEPKVEVIIEPKIEAKVEATIEPKVKAKLEPKMSKTLKIQAPIKTPLQRKLDRERKEVVYVARKSPAQKAEKKVVTPVSSDKLKELTGIKLNYKTATFQRNHI